MGVCRTIRFSVTVNAVKAFNLIVIAFVALCLFTGCRRGLSVCEDIIKAKLPITTEQLARAERYPMTMPDGERALLVVGQFPELAAISQEKASGLHEQLDEDYEARLLRMIVKSSPAFAQAGVAYTLWSFNDGSEQYLGFVVKGGIDDPVAIYVALLETPWTETRSY
jgi:hypothetical protein